MALRSESDPTFRTSADRNEDESDEMADGVMLERAVSSPVRGESFVGCAVVVDSDRCRAVDGRVDTRLVVGREDGAELDGVEEVVDGEERSVSAVWRGLELSTV